MSDYVVVDSSVAYKWFQQTGEEHVGRALTYLWRHHDKTITLVAPDTLLVEITNALRSSKLEPEEVLVLIDALSSLDIGLHESHPERLRVAASLSYRHGMSVYDALFLALAEELGCPLVTADRKAFAKVSTSVEIRFI